MNSISYRRDGGELTLARVRGTHGEPYTFGDPPHVLTIDVDDLFIGTVPVTQGLWTHLSASGSNPAVHRGADLPVEKPNGDGIFDMTTSRMSRHGISTWAQRARGCRAA